MNHMFSFMKSKKTVNIVIDDYVIRMAESSGEELSTVKLIKEEPLPSGLIEYGKIVDEIQFYGFMKNIVQKWGIKNQQVRFYVPSSLVIMRAVEYPAHLKKENIKEYFMMEIGETIHLPFQNPIFDIHIFSTEQDHQPEEDDVENTKKQGTLFAVPEDEMIKYTEIFSDVSLKPIVADVKELGVYRYFNQMNQVDQEKSYLFFEFNLTSIHLSIFHNHQLEFLRYQQLHLETQLWNARKGENNTLTWAYAGDEEQKIGTIEDQINELERIMNFYRYSLHKGEKEVSEIFILGDYPKLDQIYNRVKNQYNITTRLLEEYSETKKEKMGAAFIPALGLALKEDK